MVLRVFNGKILEPGQSKGYKVRSQIKGCFCLFSCYFMYYSHSYLQRTGKREFRKSSKNASTVKITTIRKNDLLLFNSHAAVNPAVGAKKRKISDE